MIVVAYASVWKCPECGGTFYAMSQDHARECRPGDCAKSRAAQPQAEGAPGASKHVLVKGKCPICDGGRIAILEAEVERLTRALAAPRPETPPTDKVSR
jgi:hypothetical protein